jgi:hypothetical protein
MGVVLVVAEVEVVVLSIADANEQSQNVDHSCNEEISVSTMASLISQENISTWETYA